MNNLVLYLTLGYPGSGKTTAARAIHTLTGAVHLWADKIRNERFGHPTHSREENLELYAHLNKQTAELLADGKSVVFDTAFNFYKDRQHLREIAEQYNARVVLLWVMTDKDLARQRAIHPDHAARNTYPHIMPEERFERITEDFEPPRPDEPYIQVDGTKITVDYIRDLLEDRDETAA